ncbi:MAG: hypothetical protein GF320_20780 [Armatimonadia bacterium]|nr:hypothetical protein [Armatimonadia bacterium]
MDTTLLYITYYVLLAGLGALMVYGMRIEGGRRSPGILLWLTLLVVFVIPAGISPLIDAHGLGARIGTFHPARSAFLFPGLAFAYGFSVLFLLTRMVTIRREDRWLPDPGDRELTEVLREHTAPRVATAMFLLGCAALAMTVLARIQAGGGQIRGRPEGGGLLALATFLTITAGSGMLHVWLRARRPTAIAFGGVLFFCFMLNPSRSAILPAVGPFALLVVYGGRRGAMGALLLIGGLGLAYVFFAFLQIVRWFGMDLFSSPEALTLLAERLVAGQGEFQAHWSYYFALERGHELDTFMELGAVRRTLLMPIPTGLTGGIKPLDPNNELALACYPEWSSSQYFATLHPLAFGSAYLDMGWAGVLMGVAWGLVLHGQMKLGGPQSLSRRLLWLGPVCTFWVLVGRGTVYAASTLLVGGLIATTLVEWVALHRVRYPRVESSSGSPARPRALNTRRSGP